MSYILEALRRADADRERERGGVPDLHAQPAAASNAAPPSAPRLRGGAVWVAVGVAAGLLGPLLWTWSTRERGDDAPPPAVPIAPVPPPPVAAPPPPAFTVPAVPAAAPAVPPVHDAGAGPAPLFSIAPPAPPVPAPAPAARTAAREAPAATPAATTAGSAGRGGVADGPQTGAAAGKPTTTPAAPPPPTTAAEGRLHTLAELPDDIRRQLPTVTVGGSIYSQDAANRFLIINGQIFHEKDKLAPELVLEQIKLKSAVLRFKGYRYEINY